MSRQKRESRSHKEMVYTHPVHFVLFLCAIFCGLTAPLAHLLRMALYWVATNFLHTDQPHRRTARPAVAFAPSGLRSSPPPATAGHIAAFGIPASPRSSLPLVPIPARLSAAL